MIRHRLVYTQRGNKKTLLIGPGAKGSAKQDETRSTRAEKALKMLLIKQKTLKT